MTSEKKPESDATGSRGDFPFNEQVIGIFHTNRYLPRTYTMKTYVNRMPEHKITVDENGQAWLSPSSPPSPPSSEKSSTDDTP